MLQMKHLFIILSLILAQSHCENNVQSDYIALEYSASSRGYQKQIVITKDSISTTSKRDSKLIVKNCRPEHWAKLMEAIKSIDISTLSRLEPPSKDHQFDGAAIARLSIISNGKTYETQAFDHGNAPKAIAELVKEILSISENIE